MQPQTTTRAGFIALTDLTPDTMRNHLRRGVLPFMVDDDQPKGVTPYEEREHNQYFGSDVLLSCIALEASKAGADLKMASSLAVRMPTKAFGDYWGIICDRKSGSPPVYFGIVQVTYGSELIGANKRRPVAVTRDVAFLGPIERLPDATTSMDVAKPGGGRRHLKFHELPSVSAHMVLVNVTQVVKDIDARAKKSGVPFDIRAVL